MADMDQGLGGDASIGQRLRSAREARGLSLDDVATQTRIPVRHLRAIEEGQWSDLPAITYTVGFARSYANAVGLDGAEVGREVRETCGGSQPTSLAPAYYDPPDPARVPSRALAWIAAALAILLIAGYLWWRSRLASDDQVAQTPVAAEQPTQPAQAPPPQPQQPQNVVGQPVTLVAAGDVWMDVRDGANRRLYYNTLRSGERFAVPVDSAGAVLRTPNPQNIRLVVGDQDRGLLATGRPRGSVTIPLNAEGLNQALAGAAASNAQPR